MESSASASASSPAPGKLAIPSLVIDTSAAGEGGRASTEAAPSSASAAPTTPGGTRLFSIRSLVTTKEAGVIIGRGGKNVADIREKSGARVTISEITQGTVERILTVSGTVEVIAKGFGLIAEKVLEEIAANNAAAGVARTPNSQTSFRLLVNHTRMGAIIGKSGSKIKEIQSTSGARLLTSTEMLPNSTDRTVTLHGTPLTIESAMLQIAAVLYESEKNYPSTVYSPGIAAAAATSPYANVPFINPFQYANIVGYGMPVLSPVSPGGVRGGNGMRTDKRGPVSAPAVGPISPIGAPTVFPNYPTIVSSNNLRTLTPSAITTQQIYIPKDMVGCIVGKKGVKIHEIRNLSGAQVHVQRGTETETEQLVTVTGTSEANQIAIYLIHSRLEAEKARLQAERSAQGSNNVGANKATAAVTATASVAIADSSSSSSNAPNSVESPRPSA